MNWGHAIFLLLLVAVGYYVGANHKLNLPLLG